MWQARGIVSKGDHHTVSRNTAFDVWRWHDNHISKDNPTLHIIVIQKNPNGGMCMCCDSGDLLQCVGPAIIMNENTLVEYNGVSSIGDSNGPLTQGILTGNVLGSVRPHLRDADNLDFRPVCGANSYTAGAQPVGAYELNMTNAGKYWIPGERPLNPL